MSTGCRSGTGLAAELLAGAPVLEAAGAEVPAAVRLVTAVLTSASAAAGTAFTAVTEAFALVAFALVAFALVAFALVPMVAVPVALSSAGMV
jgi:hypothetical protein